MRSPFPGMNPYLEHPDVWPELHDRLLVTLADSLILQLVPKYIVAINQRVYQTTGEEQVLIGLPDVTVKREQTRGTIDSNIAVAEPLTQPVRVTLPMPEEVRRGYLEIRETDTKQVVAAIELLSPTNKRSGANREKYQMKRQQIFKSRTHFIEIDLLRDWEPMPVFNYNLESDYRILVSRQESRPQADMYAFNLQQNIPLFALPLLVGDREPIVDLNELLDRVYERGRYDLRIDYHRSPVPLLSEADAIWANNLLKQ